MKATVINSAATTNEVTTTSGIIVPEQKIFTLEEVKASTPAAFATSPDASRSAKYSFVPTNELVEMFQHLGWGITDKGQRGKSGEHGLHMIKMENPKMKLLSGLKDNLTPQLVIHNAHNGTSALKISLGLFRFVCSNGLVVGVPGMHDSMRLRHTGITMEQVKTLSENALNQYELVQTYIGDMMQVELSKEQRLEFATNAIAHRDWYRFINPQTKEVDVKLINEMFDMESFIKGNRPEDETPTLWHTYNTIQEKLIETSVERKSPNGRTTKMSPMKDINRKHRLNTLLWGLAENYMPEAINNEFEAKFTPAPKEEKKEVIKITSQELSKDVEEVETVIAQEVTSAEHIEETFIAEALCDVEEIEPIVVNNVNGKQQEKVKKAAEVKEAKKKVEAKKDAKKKVETKKVETKEAEKKERKAAKKSPKAQKLAEAEIDAEIDAALSK